MSLSVELIPLVERISLEDIQRWNALAANPFQRWEWLGSWWRAYQQKHMLYVLKVQRDGETIAFAPWFLEKRVGLGRTLQFLGSGKVCTDHLSLLVSADDRQEVCDAIARWLIDVNTERQFVVPKGLIWDAIEFIGVDKDDPTMNCLAEAMRSHGLTVDQADGMGCYVIDLPDDWGDYVQMRSKSGRREIRQSQKNVENGVIAVHKVRDEQELDAVWDQFVDLHQRRRHASGTTGCFDHPPFGTFLRNAASELLQAELLELTLASIDGVPVAAQFALVDDDCWYFYQSGMSPDASQLRPGLSVFCHAIRETIQAGRKRFDMMRGDEPYKQRWRAELQPAQEIRVCSPRNIAQVRNQVYNAGVTFKNLVKSIGVGQHHAQA